MAELAETVTRNGQQLYAPILACRPVRFEDYPAERRAVHERVVAETGLEPGIYPGSIYQPCEDCGIEVAVGPRQQTAIASAYDVGLLAHVCCLMDAAQRAQQAEEDDVDMVNLGNPFTRGKDA